MSIPIGLSDTCIENKTLHQYCSTNRLEKSPRNLTQMLQETFSYEEQHVQELHGIDEIMKHVRRQYPLQYLSIEDQASPSIDLPVAVCSTVWSAGHPFFQLVLLLSSFVVPLAPSTSAPASASPAPASALTAAILVQKRAAPVHASPSSHATGYPCAVAEPGNPSTVRGCLKCRSLTFLSSVAIVASYNQISFFCFVWISHHHFLHRHPPHHHLLQASGLFTGGSVDEGAYCQITLAARLSDWEGQPLEAS